jgi:hypothetical protein
MSDFLICFYFVILHCNAAFLLKYNMEEIQSGRKEGKNKVLYSQSRFMT